VNRLLRRTLTFGVLHSLHPYPLLARKGQEAKLCCAPRAQAARFGEIKRKGQIGNIICKT